MRCWENSITLDTNALIYLSFQLDGAFRQTRFPKTKAKYIFPIHYRASLAKDGFKQQKAIQAYKDVKSTKQTMPEVMKTSLMIRMWLSVGVTQEWNINKSLCVIVGLHDYGSNDNHDYFAQNFHQNYFVSSELLFFISLQHAFWHNHFTANKFYNLLPFNFFSTVFHHISKHAILEWNLATSFLILLFLPLVTLHVCLWVLQSITIVEMQWNMLFYLL